MRALTLAEPFDTVRGGGWLQHWPAAGFCRLPTLLRTLCASSATLLTSTHTPLPAAPQALDVGRAGEVLTVAGTTASFEVDEDGREVYGTFPLPDGTSLRYRVMVRQMGSGG